MGKSIALGAVLLTGVLAGCVSPPPPPLLVAVPGPGKTDEAFRRDDAACRTVAAEPPPAQPVGTPASTAPATAQAQANAAAETAPAVETLPPGAVYLRCMTARQNLVQALAPAVPLHAYYQPYPIYAGVGFGYPYFYDYGYPYGYGFGFGYGRIGYGGRYFGHYGRYGGYRGYGGYGFRGGYGGGFAHGGFGHGGFGHGGFGGHR